jgi:hypothetical protein
VVNKGPVVTVVVTVVIVVRTPTESYLKVLKKSKGFPCFNIQVPSISVDCELQTHLSPNKS